MEPDRAVTFYSTFKRSCKHGKRINVHTVTSCLNSKFPVYEFRTGFEATRLVAQQGALRMFTITSTCCRSADLSVN